mmetsp:Transcript_8410/g.26319  ORF Transcript_8410/g.26319 Transcript_8410/m.26319 type:complete len:235 (-) Transcript_8410:834-1538(-)
MLARAARDGVSIRGRGFWVGVCLHADGQRAKRVDEGAERFLDDVPARVLSQHPQHDAEHGWRLGLREAVQQLAQDIRPQGRIRLHHFTHKVHHLQRPVRVQEVEQQEHHLARHVRELDCTLVDGLDQQRPVLHRVLHGLLLRAEHLLLEQVDHLAHVAGGDELEHDLQRLASDVQVGALQRAQHVHHGLLHHLGVQTTQLAEALQHDQLHVVVRMCVEQLRVRVGSVAHSSGRR